MAKKREADSEEMPQVHFDTSLARHDEDDEDSFEQSITDDLRRRTNILKQTKTLRTVFSVTKRLKKIDDDANTKNLSQQKLIKENPVFKAVVDNDVPRIQELVQNVAVDLHARGALGENALHLACLFNNTEAARALMNADPSIVNDIYESELYYGEVALHMAVVNRNFELLCELVRMGADVRNPRATGTFFRHDTGTCYYGEYVLSFAVCTGQPDVVEYLVNQGAALTAQDSTGNTALHMVVYMKNKKMAAKMYDHILRMDKDNMLELERIENHAGLSVVKLAAHLGNAELFTHMMQRRREIHWTFGPVSSAVYDLDQIDTYKEERNILELIVDSPHPSAMLLVDITPVKQILREKWVRFRKFFHMWLCLTLLYMGGYTVVLEFQPDMFKINSIMLNNSDSRPFAHLRYMYSTSYDYARLGGEIVILLGVLFISVYEIIDLRAKGWYLYVFAMQRIPICGFIFLTILGHIVYFAGSVYCRIPLSLAILCGWYYLVFFTRGFRKTGPFNVMIQTMLFGDMVRFMSIFIIVLVAFSSAFHVLFHHQPDVPKQFSSMPVILFNLFKTMVGIEEYESADIYSNPFSYMTMLFFVAYLLFAYVLLINLLIAMMGDTYSRVANEGTQIWKKQIAEVTLILERRLPSYFRGRTGTCGGEFGFPAHKWYIRVEEYNAEYDEREIDVNDNLQVSLSKSMKESVPIQKRKRRQPISILQKKKSFATYNMFGRKKSNPTSNTKISPAPPPPPYSERMQRHRPSLLKTSRGPRLSTTADFFRRSSLAGDDIGEEPPSDSEVPSTVVVEEEL